MGWSSMQIWKGGVDEEAWVREGRHAYDKGERAAISGNPTEIIYIRLRLIVRRSSMLFKA